jgi:hypothetical protein
VINARALLAEIPALNGDLPLIIHLRPSEQDSDRSWLATRRRELWLTVKRFSRTGLGLAAGVSEVTLGWVTGVPMMTLPCCR